ASSGARRHRRLDGAGLRDAGGAAALQAGPRLLGQGAAEADQGGRMTPQAGLARSDAPNPGGVPRIRVKNLAKRYGALQVFRDIDFEVGEREILAVVGPSGCGKTTLLRCIDGLLSHDEGEIWVGDQRVHEPIPGVAMVF